MLKLIASRGHPIDDLLLMMLLVQRRADDHDVVEAWLGVAGARDVVQVGFDAVGAHGLGDARGDSRGMPVGAGVDDERAHLPVGRCHGTIA